MRSLDNSATARAGRLLKLLIDQPHVYTVRMLVDEIGIGTDGIKDLIAALRIAGWDIRHDDYPDYTYHVKGYRKTFE